MKKIHKLKLMISAGLVLGLGSTGMIACDGVSSFDQDAVTQFIAARAKEYKDIFNNTQDCTDLGAKIEKNYSGQQMACSGGGYYTSKVDPVFICTNEDESTTAPIIEFEYSNCKDNESDLVLNGSLAAYSSQSLYFKKPVKKVSVNSEDDIKINELRIAPLMFADFNEEGMQCNVSIITFYTDDSLAKAKLCKVQDDCSGCTIVQN